MFCIFRKRNISRMNSNKNYIHQRLSPTVPDINGMKVHISFKWLSFQRRQWIQINDKKIYYEYFKKKMFDSVLSRRCVLSDVKKTLKIDFVTKSWKLIFYIMQRSETRDKWEYKLLSHIQICPYMYVQWPFMVKFGCHGNPIIATDSVHSIGLF